MINQYPLPQTTKESYDNWRKKESREFVPNESQQFLMNVVEEALNSGLFYESDIDRFVENKIGHLLPSDYKTKGADRVRGGIFGYEVYEARYAVEAQKKWKQEDKIKQELNLQEGLSLGTLQFKDGSTYHKVTIEEVTDKYISCMAIRGNKLHKIETTAIGIKNAMDKWQEKKEHRQLVRSR